MRFARLLTLAVACAVVVIPLAVVAALADLAQHGADAGVRWAAACRLTDQTVLADLAKRDADAGVRYEATRRLERLRRTP